MLGRLPRRRARGTSRRVLRRKSPLRPLYRPLTLPTPYPVRRIRESVPAQSSQSHPWHLPRQLSSAKTQHIPTITTLRTSPAAQSATLQTPPRHPSVEQSPTPSHPKESNLTAPTLSSHFPAAPATPAQPPPQIHLNSHNHNQHNHRSHPHKQHSTASKSDHPRPTLAYPPSHQRASSPPNSPS